MGVFVWGDNQMMMKARKKALRTFLAAVLAISLVPAEPVHASLNILGGYLIQATPFDHKVQTSGILQFYSFAPRLESVRSSDELFAQARSIRYVQDGATDYWQSPQETESRWAGDCEDKAVWLYMNMKQNGYFNARLVIGRYRQADKGYHVWVTLPDGQDNFFILDPTAQKKIWKASDFNDGSYKPLFSFEGTNRYRHSV